MVEEAIYENSVALVFSNCGCGKLIKVTTTDIPCFIDEVSNKIIGNVGYLPLAAERNKTIHFIPENYNEMSTPEKFSEQPVIEELSSEARFVIIVPTGNPAKPYENYTVDYATMLSLIAPSFRLPYTVLSTGNQLTIAGLRPVQSILMPNTTLTKSQFTQAGDTITYNQGDFIVNDEIVFNF